MATFVIECALGVIFHFVVLCVVHIFLEGYRAMGEASFLNPMALCNCRNCSDAEQCLSYTGMLVEHFNPHVRYGAAMALGISCAGSGYKV